MVENFKFGFFSFKPIAIEAKGKLKRKKNARGGEKRSEKEKKPKKKAIDDDAGGNLGKKKIVSKAMVSR